MLLLQRVVCMQIRNVGLRYPRNQFIKQFCSKVDSRNDVSISVLPAPTIYTQDVHESFIFASTRAWIQDWVIAYKLCPWAEKASKENDVEIVVSYGIGSCEDTAAALFTEIVGHLNTFAERVDEMPDNTKTMFLVLPNLSFEFLHFLEIVESIEGLIADMNIDDVVQIASFHPCYQFGDSIEELDENSFNRDLIEKIEYDKASSCKKYAKEELPIHNTENIVDNGRDDVANYTHRSPFAIIQFLNFNNVEKAIAAYEKINGDCNLIWKRNIKTMQKIGLHSAQLNLDRLRLFQSTTRTNS